MTNYSDYDEVKQNLPRLAELPFDSDRKLMSTLHCIDGQYVMYTKGALDVILDRTTILTDEEKQDIREANFSLSDQGLRVLAFARKNIGENRASVPAPVLC